MATDKKTLTKIDALVSEAVELLQELISDRQTEFDDRSEAWQDGDKGQAHTERTDELHLAYDDLENVQGTIQSLIEPA